MPFDLLIRSAYKRLAGLIAFYMTHLCLLLGHTTEAPDVLQSHSGNRKTAWLLFPVVDAKQKTSVPAPRGITCSTVQYGT